MTVSTIKAIVHATPLILLLTIDEEGNLSSSGNTYTVTKRNGKWEVTHDQMNVISRSDRATETAAACVGCFVR
jgi:hypothetical protein